MQYCTAEVPEGSLCRGYISTLPLSPNMLKLRNAPKAAKLEVEDAVTRKGATWNKAKSKTKGKHQTGGYKGVGVMRLHSRGIGAESMATSRRNSRLFAEW